MNKATKRSKFNLCFLLMTIFSVGIIGILSHITNVNAITKDTPTANSNDLSNLFNCITQKVNEDANFKLADAFVCYDSELKGSLKFESQPFQNPDLSNLNNIKPFSDNTPTTTKTTTNAVEMGGTSSSPQTQIPKGDSESQDNGIKSIWNPFNDIGKTKSTLKPKITIDGGNGNHLNQDSSSTTTDSKIVKKPTDPFSIEQNKPLDNKNGNNPTDSHTNKQSSKAPLKLKTIISSDSTSSIGSFSLPYLAILPQ